MRNSDRKTHSLLNVTIASSVLALAACGGTSDAPVHPEESSAAATSGTPMPSTSVQSTSPPPASSVPAVPPPHGSSSSAAPNAPPTPSSSAKPADSATAGVAKGGFAGYVDAYCACKGDTKCITDAGMKYKDVMGDAGKDVALAKKLADCTTANPPKM